jgi:hypothetical protein
MENKASTKEFTKKAPNVPTDPGALSRLKRYIELGELEKISPGAGLPGVPRYLVTYMHSETGGAIRTATVVSVTNQSDRPNLVSVSYFKGLTDNTSPVCMTSLSIPPDFTIDFSSRDLPPELTLSNSVCNPELVFDEGRAIVSSRRPQIGVSSRVYYTAGDRDEELLSITDSKIVRFGQANKGD